MAWLINEVDWGEAVAITIAALALVLQALQWWRGREPGLEVEISKAHTFWPREDNARGEPRNAELLVIEVRNLSAAQRANVTSVGFGVDYPDGRPMFRATTGPYEGATLPGVIEPNDSGTISRVIRRDEQDMMMGLANSDSYVYGWAWTSTGREPVESKRHVFRALPRRPSLRGDPPEPPWLWGTAREVFP
jgi:hypothetical protein